VARPGRRGKKRDGGAVPTDSFSDIAFLLIIFFMVTTTLVKTKGFETTLPSSKESTSESSQEVPTISLEGDQILYNADAMSLEDLRTKLLSLELADKEDTSLRIIKLKSGANIPYESYYAVWAVIAKAGGIVTLVKEKK
jgi:biopolymer transport protein ExbD